MGAQTLGRLPAGYHSRSASTCRWPGTCVQDIADMKLVHMSSKLDMDDADTLSGLKVENDDVLCLCYRNTPADGMPLAACAHIWCKCARMQVCAHACMSPHWMALCLKNAGPAEPLLQ